MRRIIFLFALSALLRVFAVDPYIGYIYPSGIQAGTTNRFIIGGQNFWKLRGMYFGSDSLRVIDIKQVPNLPFTPTTQRRHLLKWLDGIAKGDLEEPKKPKDIPVNEWRSNSWYRAVSSLDELERSILERFLTVPRNPLQAAPSLRQMAIVTIAADADAKIGSYDASIWHSGGISAPRPFFVTDMPRKKEPLYSPPHRPKMEVEIFDVTEKGVVLDGQIMPGETDAFRLRLNGKSEYRLKVVARELQPYVGDAVPGFFNPAVVVKDSLGNVVAFGDDTSRFKPDPIFNFVPPFTGEYTIEIHDLLYRGRADFVYSIEIAPYVKSEKIAETKEDDILKDGVLCFSGKVSEAEKKSTCEFTVEKPGKKFLEVFARRDGSSLDAVLALRKASSSQTIMQWDDVTNKVFVGTIPQVECDPVGEYDFTEAGRYVAEITDRTGHGGDDYFWKLEVRDPTPQFEVYSTRSTLPISNTKDFKMDFVIVRKDGYNGTVTLEFPKEIAAKNCVATSGVERITTLVKYASRKYSELKPIKIFARGISNGKILRREVVACDEYEQAFAWRHLVPAQSFLLRGVFIKPSGDKKSAQNKTKKTKK